MWRIPTLAAMVVLAAACSSTERVVVVVAEHSEHQVTTTIELVETSADGLALTATFAPDGERMHVYDTELPTLGIDGFGRPTRFAVVSGALVATGPAVADVEPIMLSVPATDSPIPVYPDGPVTLTLPVEVQRDGAARDGNDRVDVEISISYMACTSDGGCSPPVTDHRVVGTIDLPPQSSSRSQPPSQSQVPSGGPSVESAPPVVDAPLVVDERPDDVAVSVPVAPLPDLVDGLFVVDQYDPTRDPAADLDAAVQLAARTDREVVAVVGGDWCPDCWYLDSFIGVNDELEAALRESFVFLKVNISDENENLGFLADYPDFSWVPHMFVVGSDGELVDSVDTRLLMSDGRFDAEAFSDVLVSRSTES
ncbi:MAG: thioredoxin family protein [Ilumatobacter sp.]